MTPLQILSFYNAIANDGIRVKPRFIKRIMNKGQDLKIYDKPIIENSVCSAETAKILQDLLQKTVEKEQLKTFTTKISAWQAKPEHAKPNTGLSPDDISLHLQAISLLKTQVFLYCNHS